MFEKVAAAKTVRPPWLRPWGVSAAAAAHAAMALAVAAIPVRSEAPSRTVEEATFMVLLQAPRAPDRLFRLAAGAEDAVAATPPDRGAGEEDDGVHPFVADLRLAFPGDSGAVPEIATVPRTFNGAADLRALAAAAGALARGVRGTALLAGGGETDSGVVPAEMLAEPPRMVNQREITRLLMRLYPRRLLSNRVQGDVTLTFIIGLDGRVEMRSVKVMAAGHPDLAEPTLRALAAMRFRPARVSGEAVRVRAILPVRWVLQ